MRKLCRGSEEGGTLRTFDIVLDEQFIQNASLLEIAFALIHETIHAEIMERCIFLGIITGLNYNSFWDVSVNWSNGQVSSTVLSDVIFANLLDNYSSYGGPPANTNWQHELFSVLGYRTKIKEDLVTLHPWLDASNNPFINNLNNGTVLTMTLDDFFNYITWLGLESTSDYNNLSNLDLTKITQAKNQMQSFYNQNCN